VLPNLASRFAVRMLVKGEVPPITARRPAPAKQRNSRQMHQLRHSYCLACAIDRSKPAPAQEFHIWPSLRPSFGWHLFREAIFRRNSAVRCWEQFDSGIIGTDANAERAKRHVLRVRGSMSAGVLVGNEQRSIGQFNRLSVSIAVVDEKALIWRWCNPRLTSIGAEDQSQSSVSRCIGTV
jgi:hypothetical protein